ncbi:hypothetical protein [Mesorhizobium kowhaii]|uniref:hypothetical protein n=1 Tax=Mesorhizobium kowhaii TaxID=1300272 RepID=UPI00366BF486
MTSHPSALTKNAVPDDETSDDCDQAGWMAQIDAITAALTAIHRFEKRNTVKQTTA